MNIGQLKELIKDLNDDVEVISSVCLESGRSWSGCTTDNVRCEYYDETETYDYHEEDEEITRSNIFVITIEGTCQWDE